MRRVDRWIKALVVANVIIVVLLVAAFSYDRFNGGNASATGSPKPSPTKDLMAMGPAHIPTNNACVLCHTSGGSAGIKPIPALGHPLEGWRSCLTCHTNEDLGRKAPGHLGIDESECTNCHKVAPQGPAITQAHSQLSQPCLTCHGNVAHLPSSMVGRDQTECWLCHKPNPSEPPQKPHPYDGRLSCRSCHQSADVGALPIDHALRADTTCLLCHDIGSQPTQPLPSLDFETPKPNASPSP